MNARTARILLLVAVLAAGAGCGHRHEVLFDFEGDTPPAEITTIGGAVLSTEGGSLVARTRRGAYGIRIPLGEGLACIAFEDVTLSQTSVPGDSVVWRWIVRDDTGSEYTLLESRWEHTSSSTFVTQKKNSRGETVQTRVVISDATVSSFRPFRVAFDRRVRNGQEEVQLEFRDPNSNRIKKLFPWIDPQPTLNVAIEIVTNLEEFTIGEIAGSNVHQDSDLPEFPQEEFQDVPYEEFLELQSPSMDTTATGTKEQPRP